jgi:hypothetical protein
MYTIMSLAQKLVDHIKTRLGLRFSVLADLSILFDCNMQTMINENKCFI